MPAGELPFRSVGPEPATIRTAVDVSCAGSDSVALISPHEAAIVTSRCVALIILHVSNILVIISTMRFIVSRLSVY